MGVIKKNDSKIGVSLCGSSSADESLGIPPSSEDERSVASVEEFAPARAHPPPSRKRAPVPMYFPSARRKLGKKKSRHQENVTHLMTLVEEDEDLKEVTIYDLRPDPQGGFSKILNDQSAFKIWDEFINSSEEVQETVLQRNAVRPSTRHPNSPSGGSGAQLTGEQAFRNIKAGIRNKLKKTQVPQGMMDHLESSLVEFFTRDASKTYISASISSFERLLLHAISQYHRLSSLSIILDEDNTRVVRVHYPLEDMFQVPTLLLGQYLQVRRSSRNSHCVTAN